MLHVSVSPRRLVVFLVLLAPLVNNINGFMKWKFGISVLGPMFYAFFFVSIVLILLSLAHSRADLIRNYVLIGCIAVLFVIHIPMFGVKDDYPGYVKMFLPFLLLRFLRLHYKGPREPISGLLEWATLLWTFFAVVTAVLRIRPAAGEGYYGFVHGNNDYVVMLFAIFPLTTLWKHKTPLVMYYLAIVLTRSKGLVALAPMMILLPKSNKARLAILVVAGGILFLTITYYVRYFLSNFGASYELTPMSFLAFVSFGRLKYLFQFFENLGDKSFFEHLVGSGFEGGLRYLGGKVGIEMDPFDAYNVYGALGFLLGIYFYYWQVLRLKNHTWRTKVKFLPLIGYSIAGGHLFNNPMSNLVFVLVLFIFEGRVEEGFEERRSGKKAVPLAKTATVATG